MKLSLVTAATELPVSVAEMKDRSRISTSSEDALIAEMLEEATRAAEEYTWSRFISQTWDAYCDRFADLKNGLPYPPASSVTSVTYVDTDGDTQTVSTDTWELGEEMGIGVVRLKYDQSWPTDVRSHSDAVIVRLICGYGAASAVPQGIKAAIILHAGAAYECREQFDSPRAFCNLLGPYSYRSFRPPFWGNA